MTLHLKGFKPVLEGWGVLGKWEPWILRWKLLVTLARTVFCEMVRAEAGWREWDVRKLKSVPFNIFSIPCPLFLLIEVIACICRHLSYPHTPSSISSHRHSHIYEMCFPLPEGTTGILHEKPHNLRLHLVNRPINPFYF